MHVFRKAHEPIRIGLTTEERWLGADKGLTAAWECGRELADKNTELAARARAGELFILPWKGGVERALKIKEKYGTLRYLAMWRGLRGDHLDVGLDKNYELTCSVTGQKIIYTGDFSKYAGQEGSREERETSRGSLEPAY